MTNPKRNSEMLIVGEDSQDSDGAATNPSKKSNSIVDVSGAALLITFAALTLFFGGRGAIAAHSIKLILFLAVIVSCARILISKIKSINNPEIAEECDSALVKKSNVFFYFVPITLYLIFQNISLPLDFLGILSAPAKVAYEKSNSLVGSISIDRSESMNALSWVFLFISLYCLGLGVKFKTYSVKEKVRSSRRKSNTVFFSKESREFDSYSELIQKVVIGVSLVCAVIGITHLMMQMRSLFGIFTFADDYQFSWRAHWPLVNANQLAVIVEMGTMLCFTRFLRERQLRSLSISSRSNDGILKNIEQVFYSLEKQAVTLIMIFVQLICLIFTFSRAGISLTFIGMTLLWVMYKLNPVVLTTQRSENQRRKNQSSNLKFNRVMNFLKISMFPFVLFLLLFSFLGDDVSSRLSSRVDKTVVQNGDASRSALNEISLNVFNLNPLFGIGLNNWENAADQFSFDQSIGWKLDYAHNDYLQMVSEIGLVGLLLVLVPLIPAIKNILVIKRTHLGPVRTVFIAGLFLSFMVPAIHAFVDFPYHLPILSMGIMLLFLALSRSVMFLMPKD